MNGRHGDAQTGRAAAMRPTLLAKAARLPTSPAGRSRMPGRVGRCHRPLRCTQSGCLSRRLATEVAGRAKVEQRKRIVTAAGLAVARRSPLAESVELSPVELSLAKLS